MHNIELATQIGARRSVATENSDFSVSCLKSQNNILVFCFLRFFLFEFYNKDFEKIWFWIIFRVDFVIFRQSSHEDYWRSFRSQIVWVKRSKVVFTQSICNLIFCQLSHEHYWRSFRSRTNQRNISLISLEVLSRAYMCFNIAAMKKTSLE